MTGPDFERESRVKLFIYLVAILLLELSSMIAHVISAGWTKVFERKKNDAFLQQ